MGQKPLMRCTIVKTVSSLMWPPIILITSCRWSDTPRWQTRPRGLGLWCVSKRRHSHALKVSALLMKRHGDAGGRDAQVMQRASHVYGYCSTHDRRILACLMMHACVGQEDKSARRAACRTRLRPCMHIIERIPLLGNGVAPWHSVSMAVKSM